MRLLLDTHIAIWWLYQPDRIASDLRVLIQDQAHAVWVSQASLWEMAIKINLGRLGLDLQTFADQLPLDGFLHLPIRNEHLISVAELEQYPDHRDPFDRLLVAQSRCEPLLLLTHDQKLKRYGATVRVFPT